MQKKKSSLNAFINLNFRCLKPRFACKETNAFRLINDRMPITIRTSQIWTGIVVQIGVVRDRDVVAAKAWALVWPTRNGVLLGLAGHSQGRIVSIEQTEYERIRVGFKPKQNKKTLHLWQNELLNKYYNRLPLQLTSV